MPRLQLELHSHRRNRKIPEDEKVRTRKECETKQEGIESCETRMDSSLRSSRFILDFANAKVIDKGNHRNLKTLESWHTALADEADNNSNTLL